MIVQNEVWPEFIGSLIDVVEDFLDSKSVLLPNTEKEGDEYAAIIYGSDYDELSAALEHMLSAWGIMKEERYANP